jgi:hypothetical protein
MGDPTMSLQEAQRRRFQRQHAQDDQLVYTFREWCVINGISPRTGRRIIDGKNGPVVTRLSPRRIGVTRANNARWQKSREHAA